MERKEALTELLDKVEAGTCSNDGIMYRAFGDDWTNCFDTYYNGSLDAAKALHEAVLPGWLVTPKIGGAGAGVMFWHCNIENWATGEEIFVDNQKCPTRAWLIAIIKALIAEETQ